MWEARRFARRPALAALPNAYPVCVPWLDYSMGCAHCCFECLEVVHRASRADAWTSQQGGVTHEMPSVDDMMEYAQHVSGIGSQFAHPRGILGQLAGYLLARTATARSLWVLSQLDLQPDDRVLEVGFGPGMDVQRVSAITVDGFVAGIDASAVMVRQAHNRNAEAIRAGRVELRQASMDEPLPYPDASFTKVFSINSFPFWRNKGAALKEVYRVLRPGGVIAIAVQPVMRGATEELVRATGEWLVRQLEETGFRNVYTRVGPTKPMGTACAIGRK